MELVAEAARLEREAAARLCDDYAARAERSQKWDAALAARTLAAQIRAIHGDHKP